MNNSEDNRVTTEMSDAILKSEILTAMGAAKKEHSHSMSDIIGLTETLARMSDRIDKIDHAVNPPVVDPSNSRDEHYIFHPDDTFIKTFAWLNTRPAGETHVCIDFKDANYVGPMDVAVGAGRNGKNAIRMTSNGRLVSGDPAFWLYPSVSTGGSRTNPTGDNGFIVPPNKRANRFEAWCRFPPGYKEAFGAALDYYSDTCHVGTYNAFPAGTTGSAADGSLVVPGETAGWHWYHQLRVRWDWLDDNEWVCITCNPIVDNYRGDHGRNNYPKDPTLPHAEYFRCLTRLYLEWPPYWAMWDPPGSANAIPWNDAGLQSVGFPTPFSIYIDSIRFYWRNEYLPVEIRFGPSGDWLDAQEYECASAPATTDIPFRITNVTNASVTGRLAFRGRSMNWSPVIIDQVSSAQFAVATYTLAAGETKHFWLRVSPTTDGSISAGFPNSMGIVFEPSTELIPYGRIVDIPWGANMLMKSSNRVEKSAYHGVGGPDYDICSRNIGLVWAGVGGTPSNYRPTSRGGQVYQVPLTVTSQFQLPGHDPAGGSLTFTKGNSQAGRGTLTIASNGVVTYTPPSVGWTGTCHFSYQINGAGAKPSIWYGAWVNVEATGDE